MNETIDFLSALKGMRHSMGESDENFAKELMDKIIRTVEQQQQEIERLREENDVLREQMERIRKNWRP